MANILYKTSDDVRKMPKTLTEGVSLTQMIIKQPCSLLKPVIIVNYFTGIMNYNYFYSDEFGRYYYIDKITMLSGGRVELSCSIDVLETYNNDIRTLSAILVRSELNTPTEITDTSLPIHKAKNVKVYEFSGGDINIDTATNYSYNFVINIMGGGANNVNN